MAIEGCLLPVQAEAVRSTTAVIARARILTAHSVARNAKFRQILTAVASSLAPQMQARRDKCRNWLSAVAAPFIEEKSWQ
jgi:hypothetical protein